MKRVFVTAISTALLLFAGSAHAQSANTSSWNGTWTGNWGRGMGTVTIDRGKVVGYSFNGSPQTLTKSQVSASSVSFGSDRFTVTLDKAGPNTASGTYSGPQGTAAGTFTKR